MGHHEGGIVKAEKRREKLLRIIRHNPDVSNAELSGMLRISNETLRNDLILLESEGVLKRTHGRPLLLRDERAIRKLARNGVLSKDERHREILKILAERGEVRSAALSQELNVSEATIRNDLAALEQAGKVRRSHGGAELTVPARAVNGRGLMRFFDEPVPKPTVNICERAISLIEEGDVVYLDDSVCGMYIARRVPFEKEITIVTNSLRNAVILSERGCPFDVYVLPGFLRREEYSTDARFYDEISDRFYFTRAFLHFQAYTPGRGFFVENRDQFDLFSIILATSREFFILMESELTAEKGRYGFPLDGKLPLLTEIVTDDRLTPERAASVFPEEYPVVLCGDNYTIKSPFNKQYVIAYASLYGGYEFSQTVRKSIEAAAARYSNIELFLTDNKMDPETTLQNVNLFIEKKVDLVIEYQHHFSLSPLISEKLSSAGIPLLAIDIPIPGAVYFGVNNYEAGLTAGKAAAEEVRAAWGGRVDRIILVTEENTGPVVRSRTEGMLEGVLGSVAYDRDRVVTVNCINAAVDSEEKIGTVLETLGRTERVLILSFNDIVTLGVLSALKHHEREDRSMVVSMSYITPIAKELKRPGTPLLGSVAFFPEEYGARIIELALAILQRKTVKQTNYIQHVWMSRS